MVGGLSQRGLLIALMLVLFATGPLAVLSAQGKPHLAKGREIAKRYVGVNIGSGSFGGQNRPGQYGLDYAYPTTAEANPFRAAGMNAVRVPFLWERIQYGPDAPIEHKELARLDAAIAALHGFDLIILDAHNFGAYRGIQVNAQNFPPDALPNLWSQLARHYRHNEHIAFGIMNEPYQIDAPAWRTIAQQTLLAIRNTRARNLILVSGTNWDGAHSWLQGGSQSNGAVLAGLTDPGNNMAFEMHQYADYNSSGTHWTCVTPREAADRLDDATQWLRMHHQRGFLGEFGTSAEPNCLLALGAMLQTVSDASDVWLGWTYWSAGARWGKYPMSVQPGIDGPKPQMAVLTRFVPK